jgi:hypothetical protein
MYFYPSASCYSNFLEKQKMTLGINVARISAQYRILLL